MAKKKKQTQWYEHDGRAYFVEVGSRTEERLKGYKAKKITVAAAKKLEGGPVDPEPVQPPLDPPPAE